MVKQSDRVQALRDSEPAWESFDGYFFRAGDKGVVVDVNNDGAWVKWDDNDRADGIWHASFDNLEVLQ